MAGGGPAGRTPGRAGRAGEGRAPPPPQSAIVPRRARGPQGAGRDDAGRGATRDGGGPTTVLFTSSSHPEAVAGGHGPVVPAREDGLPDMGLVAEDLVAQADEDRLVDRKSTRLNS